VTEAVREALVKHETNGEIALGGAVWLVSAHV